MTLKKWIEDNGGRAAREWLAQQLGVSPVTVWRWAVGEGVPRADVALRIEDETDGQVPVAAWRQG